MCNDYGAKFFSQFFFFSCCIHVLRFWFVWYERKKNRYYFWALPLAQKGEWEEEGKLFVFGWNTHGRYIRFTIWDVKQVVYDQVNKHWHWTNMELSSLNYWVGGCLVENHQNYVCDDEPYECVLKWGQKPVKRHLSRCLSLFLSRSVFLFHFLVLLHSFVHSVEIFSCSYFCRIHQL